MEGDPAGEREARPVKGIPLSVDDGTALARSLEIAAMRCEDFEYRVFRRFFGDRPQFAELFSSPASTYGRMVSDSLELLLAQAEGEGWVPSAIDMLVREHMGYGRFVSADFRAFLIAARDETLALSGEDGTDAMRACWDEAIAGLMERVEEVHAAIAARRSV